MRLTNVSGWSHGTHTRGAIRGSHSETTGSVIDEEESNRHYDLQGYWPLSVFAAQREFGCRTATTGQVLVVVRYEVDAPKGPVFLRIDAPKVAASPAVVLQTVRDAFAMNISEAAEAFGITRQTAYQWLKLTDMGQVRSRENRERLKQLYAAALTWKELPPLTGRWLHALLPTGQTLLDLLKAPKIDADMIRSAHTALTSSSNKRRTEEGERTTQAVASFATAFVNLASGPKNPKGAA